MADKVEVELVRAYWTGEDERKNAGEIVAIEVDEAMRLVETGVAKTILKRPELPPLPTKAKG